MFIAFVIVVYVISAVFGMLEVTVIVIHSIHSINNSLVIEYCIHDIWGWQHYIHCSAHLRSVMLKSLWPIIYYNHGDVSDLLLRRI